MIAFKTFPLISRHKAAVDDKFMVSDPHGGPLPP